MEVEDLEQVESSKSYLPEKFVTDSKIAATLDFAFIILQCLRSTYQISMGEKFVDYEEGKISERLTGL